MRKHAPHKERKHFDMLIEKTGETYYGNLRPVAKIRFQRKAEEISKLIGETHNPRLLEYGCGTGILSRYLLKLRPHLTIQGIDVSPKAIAVARKSMREFRNTHFQAADALNLPFRDDTFDFVIGNSILHHIKLGSALREIKRVLKPNGSVWFCEPNILNPQIAIEKNVPILKSLLQDSEDERAYSRWGIARDLRNAGFREVSATPYEFLHPLIPGPLLPVLAPSCILLERVPVLKEFSGTIQIVAVNGKS